jgi:hypothetical protein
MFSQVHERENRMDFADLLNSRIKQAISLRKAINIPSKFTSAYRLIK